MRASAALLLLVACRAPSTPPACPRVVRGACVDDAIVARYCGPAAHWDGTCVPAACPASQVRDEVTGECLGARALRAIGERQHLEEAPSCREGLVLRVARGHARCDAVPAPMPRDRCPAGSALDLSRPGACLPLRADGVVDAGAWARAILGAGEGAPWLCARLGVDPAAYGLVSGAETTVELEIEVVAPNNDVTLAHARTRAAEVTSGGVHRPLPNAAEALAAGAVDAQVELFRALGGIANAGATSSRVRCGLRAGTAPQGAL